MNYPLCMNYDYFAHIDNMGITVCGFFGALTFTAMVLLMQFSEDIQFSEVLIPWTATVSFFFIITTMGFVNANVEKSHPNRYVVLMKSCFLIGFYGLIFLIPFLVYSFTIIGAIIIGIMEIIIVIVFTTSISGQDKKKTNA